jgi:hypothetical protein
MAFAVTLSDHAPAGGKVGVYNLSPKPNALDRNQPTEFLYGPRSYFAALDAGKRLFHYSDTRNVPALAREIGDVMRSYRGKATRPVTISAL